MIRTLLLTAALSFSAPAFAATFTAETVNTFEKSETIIADGVAWECEGNTCEAEGKRSKPNLRTCSKLVRETGALVSLSSENGALDADVLEKCNLAAK